MRKNICALSIVNEKYFRKYEKYLCAILVWGKKSLEGVAGHDEGLGGGEEGLLAAAEQGREALPGHAVYGGAAVDGDTSHAEEVRGPGARPYLGTLNTCRHGAIFQWIFQYYLVSFRPQRAKNTVQTTIAFADHQNIICMNYELQFVLLYPCSSHNTWACASRQIWNMTLYNKMLDHDNCWPQFLVVQFEGNLEPAAVPGAGPLHLLPPLPHLRLHFILLNIAIYTLHIGLK